MKRKKRSPLQRFGKNTSLTTLFAILLYAFFELSQHVKETPTELPGSTQPVLFYSNQTHDDLTKVFTTAIDNAKQSITLVIYALLDHQIIHSLQKKIEEGVSVFVVCDAKASPGISQHLSKATLVRRTGEGLMHQKILIVDGQKVMLGSANFTTDSLRTHGNLVVGIENPSLAEVLMTRAKNMSEDGLSPPFHCETLVDNQKIELWLLPDPQLANQRVKQLLESAKKSLKVAMFTWTRLDFVQEIVKAAKRGVKVDIVIDRYQGKGAGSKVVKALCDAHLPCALSQGKGLLHHKFAYIDETTLINGSANWTHSAFKTNDDCFIVISPLTPKQQYKMNQLWSVIKQESEVASAN